VSVCARLQRGQCDFATKKWAVFRFERKDATRVCEMMQQAYAVKEKMQQGYGT